MMTDLFQFIQVLIIIIKLFEAIKSVPFISVYMHSNSNLLNVIISVGILVK